MSSKILLVTGNYLPGKNGGIENYTHWLAKHLIANNCEVEVAALNVVEKEDYIYEGIKVNNLNGLFTNFEVVLKNGAFDICHFHEYSGFNGIDIRWFKKAKQYCTKVFFTFHLPYLTCYKNDFRYKGVEDCNTFSDSKRCTECVTAEKMGYKKWGESDLVLAAGMSLMGITGQKGKLENKILLKYQQLNELIATCDQLFIYADWFKNILSSNGYDSVQIQKIPYKSKSITTLNERDDTVKNRMLFVGRIQQQKGLHLLCEAMKNITNKNIVLDVYGNIVDQQYFDSCKRAYSFNFKGTTDYLDLLQKLNDYDFLVLPSVFTEMYSMIIKDAFYEQLPVIASAAKGNVDAVTEGKAGFIFEYDNAESLANTIDKAYQLKHEGWKPEFDYIDNSNKEMDEIISYYK